MTDPRKRSWPLIALAVCSFVPVLGIFFGAAAATWGLVSSRPRALLGAGVGAAGALLNMLGMVLLAIGMSDNPTVVAAQQHVTRQELAQLVQELETYRTRHDAYPGTLQALLGSPIPTRFLNIHDQSGGFLTRTRPYQYRLAPDGAGYDLFGVGPDDTPDTPDDVRPELPDSLQRVSGYRPGR
jgi:protein-S-isoprenylcysteine O-methyltransferase Ste14